MPSPLPPPPPSPCHPYCQIECRITVSFVGTNKRNSLTLGIEDTFPKLSLSAPFYRNIQCCWGAFWREIILAHEKNNLLYLLIFQSPFLPFFLLSLLSFFPRSSRVVVMVNRCHGERASKTRVTPGTFYQSFYYLSKSCQKELEKEIRAPDHIWSNSRWRLIQTAKTKCSVSKLVNWLSYLY